MDLQEEPEEMIQRGGDGSERRLSSIAGDMIQEEGGKLPAIEQ